MSRMITAKCPDCGIERMILLSNYLRGNKSGLCLKCFNVNHNHTGRPPKNLPLLHDGYILIYCPDHPRAVYGGFVKRAVLMLEQSLDRHLLKTEHVHHLNGIRDDDRPENLTVLSNSEHVRLHMTAKPNIKNRYTRKLEPKAGARWFESHRFGV